MRDTPLSALKPQIADSPTSNLVADTKDNLNKLYEPSNKDNGAPDKPVRQFHLDLWLGSENLSVATT